MPRSPHILDVSPRWIRRPSTPTTRARSTGRSCDGSRAVRRIGQERADAVDLRLLDVDQEHVGRVLRHLHRELAEQARLQRPDADDEERAESDREQNHARLIARTRQVQHGVTQRKRPRLRQRRDGRHQRAAGPVQRRTPDRRNPRTRRGRPAATRPARPRARPAPRRPRQSRPGRTQSRGWGVASSRSSSDGLTNRTCSSGTTENSSDTSTPMPMPCSAALHVTPYCASARSDADEPSASGMAPTARRASSDAEQAAGEAERHHLQEVDRR